MHQTTITSFNFGVTKNICDRSVSNAKEAVEESETCHFIKLPIELFQRIGLFIEDDRSLENYRRACSATHDALDADSMSFWRRRYLATFEKPVDRVTNLDYRQRYLSYNFWLKKGAYFKKGHCSDETRSLKVLRNLMIDAFSEKDDSNSDLVYQSVNMQHVLKFVANHDIIREIFNPLFAVKCGDRPAEPLLQMIQVLLTPCILDLDLYTDVNSYPDSQIAVYATAHKRPIFIDPHGTDIDMDWLLHNINFWKYHMFSKDELTLHDSYSSLPRAERPQFWISRIGQDKQHSIGRRWKGAYGFVDRADIVRVRRQGYEKRSEIVQDEFSGNEDGGEFQELDLKLVGEEERVWPDIFEQALQSQVHLVARASGRVTRGRAQKRSRDVEEIKSLKSHSFRFNGGGEDGEEVFLADGWFNQLPKQHEVPGWQRMTMMKYFEDDYGNLDTSALWAYEGVVLPGGQCIVGRWWCPEEDPNYEMYSGPFLLWCVDGGLDKDSQGVES